MSTSAAEQAAMRRALALAATPGVPLGPNPRVGCVLLDDDGRTRRRGLPPRRRQPARRGRRAAPRPATAPAARTAVVTLEPCNHTGRTGPCAQALVDGRRTPAWSSPRPTPTRSPPAARATLRAAGVEVERGLLADEARAAQPGLDVRGRARPPVRDLEVRHHPRRPQRRRRRHQPLGLQRAPPAATPTGCAALVRRDAGRHQHRRGRRPAADRPRRARPAARRAQPLRAVMGERDLPADRRVFDDRAETVHLRTRDPHEALAELLRPRPPARLPRGRPDAGRGVPAGRPGRRGRRLRRADAARRRPARRGRPRHHHHRRRVATSRSPTSPCSSRPTRTTSANVRITMTSAPRERH